MESIKDLDIQSINQIIKIAQNFKKINTSINTTNDFFKNYIFGLLFFEPSTRTCLSFESAIHRLGGKIIKYQPEYSSEKKGESLQDTIRTIDSYVDVFIIRHPKKNIISEIKKYTSKPIINAGDGDGEHPTQALLDLFTILDYYPSLPNKVSFTGDIKYSRTIHSLVYLLKKLKSEIEFYFVSDKQLQPEESLLKGMTYKILPNFESIIEDVDVLYVTRLQKERFTQESQNIENITIDKKLINKSKDSLIIMHPLPRNNELSTDLDNDKKSKYFEQVSNGVYVRMSILSYVVSKLNDQYYQNNTST
jgi:aspartate carbamoyltransferase catalytic subunit